MPPVPLDSILVSGFLLLTPINSDPEHHVSAFEVQRIIHCPREVLELLKADHTISIENTQEMWSYLSAEERQSATDFFIELLSSTHHDAIDAHAKMLASKNKVHDASNPDYVRWHKKVLRNQKVRGLVLLLGIKMPRF